MRDAFMIVTGTHFNYYQLCHRKLWLFANSINMEQESDLVYEGKLVHESSYPQRTSKYEKVEIDGIKVDYYDAKNKVIHEIKKSNKVDKAHELSNTLPDAKAVDEIMGIEGNIRQAYYAAFDIILDDFNMGPWNSVMMRLSVIVL